ncbi:MAG: CoA pyrophosphatase [Actinomycetota bacterium]
MLGDLTATTQDSAVLCVLYDDVGGPHVLLTRRSPTMRHHAHEVSFPGGRRDDTDADLWATALREAEEEVALDPSSVVEVGGLDRFTTVGSRSLIHPYVAVSETVPAVQVASPGEVEAIVTVSLAELLSDIVWREEIWGMREFGGPRALSFFEIEGDTIWGATGSMLRQLLAIATGTDGSILGGPG